MTHRLSIPLLLVAALLAWALLGPTDPLLPPAAVTPATREPAPDSYAHGVVARQYNADGSLRSQTEATTLRRFEAQGRVELLAPRRRQFDGDDEWFASADRGLLQERRDLLRLSGTARLRYLTGAAQFDTEELLIDLRNRIARSLTPVLLVQEDGHRLRAQRLVADLERRRAVFTGDVASVYVPARR